MRVSNSLVLGGMGVAAAAMIVVPLVIGPGTGGPDSAPPPSPTPTLSSSPTPAPTRESPTAAPVPTETIKPNSTTVQKTLAEAVEAYSAEKDREGGVTETVFASNGYATQVRQAPNGDVVSETGSPTVPQVVRHSGVVYAQLAGAELADSQRLRDEVGKPAADWTTDVGRIAPIINQWLYPADLAAAWRALLPGLTFDDMYTQDDGTLVVVAVLDPGKVTDGLAREAFKLDDAGADPFPTHFGVAPTGELARMVVGAPSVPTQVVVKNFEKVDVSPPPADKVITAEDVQKALDAATS